MLTDNALHPASLHNPCPICGDITRDCRLRDDGLVLCHSFIDGVEHDTLTYVKPTVDGIWGIYAHRNEDYLASKQEKDRYKLILQAKRQERLERQAKKFSEGLTRQERDRAIRTLATVGLLTKHRQDLHRRGLNDDQITQGLFFSVYPGMPLPAGIPDRFPGAKNNHFQTKATGYACVAFDASGYATGFQIRDEDPKAQSKYVWPRSHFSSHLQNGEMPLSVAGELTDGLLLTEGILKPRITSHKLGGIRVIGASGGNFVQTQQQLRVALGKCRRIILCPDAGDVLNRHAVLRWEKTAALFPFTYRVEVAWWGQFDKQEKDIDELDSWDGVEFIPLQKWKKLI